MKNYLESIKHYVGFFIIIGALTFVMTLLLSDKHVDLNQYTMVTIAQGDTLWGLALEYEQHHQLSSNEFIQWVEKMNELNKVKIETLSPGEQLYIPVLKEEINYETIYAIKEK
ncbi:cell division suppressor protein YneA [Metabacillus iocasae]|uniref:Cell division protein YceG involved in septum cleavage n=1 Tax=Priestia iocasae TaxID=2291674 RepID=A0ABS2QRN3_9BACI|nr:LysM peptidoglycan-binding domain-containing protein [Metabacillus iocasae]MBM7701963.1 cell division protein YceG involved in septum cleavage [Metabacillus iocasae]